MNALPPRPHRNLPAIREAACAKLMPKLVAWNGGNAFPFTAAQLARWADDNGYSFARSIEDFGRISPNAELVEVLESYFWFSCDAVAAATRLWVRENAIAVPFIPGQRGRVLRWSIGEERAGRISEIDAEQATILFVPDHDAERFAAGGGWVVNVEDFEPDPAEGGAA